MANIRESRLLRVLLRTAELALVGLLAGFLGFQWWKAAHRPLRPAPQYEFPKTEMTQSERERFLDGDFTIVKDMKALPRPVLRLFTEEGGSRLLMANPGENFNSTDVIYDQSIPRKRLIFAGVSGDKCFVFYEQGGIGLSDILAFIALTSKETTQQLWKGYCEPVADFQDLRSRVRSGQCSDPVP
jgi:hypothetical protein